MNGTFKFWGRISILIYIFVAIFETVFGVNEVLFYFQIIFGTLAAICYFCLAFDEYQTIDKDERDELASLFHAFVFFICLIGLFMAVKSYKDFLYSVCNFFSQI